MKEDQFLVLSEKIDQLQKSLDIIDRDLARDREDLQDFRMRLAALESQVDELRKIVTIQGNKVQEKVAETIEPLMEGIEDKKIVEYKRKSILSEIKKFLGRR